MPSAKTFETIGEFLHMAKYTLFLESINIWCYEIISLMSGFLTVNDQAALAVDWNIKMLLIYLPYSFYLSITTLVGTTLGEGNIPQAKKIGKLNVYISLIFSTFILVGCQSFIKEIVNLYTVEPTIESVAVQGLLAYVLVSFPFEYLVNLLIGYISGVGI